MGLSPGARGKYAPRLPRIPPPRPKPASRTAGTGRKDQQPAPRRSTAPHSEESVGSAALVQLPAKQPRPGTLEQGRSIQQGEKPVVSLETTLSQKADWSSIPKPENKGEEFEVGSISSIFSNRAVVKYSRLEDVLHGCSWKVNNKLDGTYLPLPVDKIIQRTKKMVNKIVQYSLIEGNCEHFVNGLRYGVPRSQQVEHALMEGAKAAGAVISAVVDSIKPKPITA
ncbi:phospholipase A and acyltransferase 5 isoform X2 [Papio anubis]|uniref:phospholipase A and acyltransferase 5 isoform X2 n=1 Tax=Papio anubis TaxID=9555 RepID=UPI0012ADD3BE|nr:phospholipase A and acyltransferase 5 isoform X2 [Papio anubis]